ncbi:hypothetical protein [Limnoglobus roseus]|uniref:Uncharacterized protein n=1 Tax=Limnoglobus roseus TaxID=2598579 RepID=A0A5C1AKH2_9BACT|nr:hypothetical protein [Limnoglobus roseus]QEL18703.1 hypothetical protein PX52LOC_05739 [Limnoglobus roseus]
MVQRVWRKISPFFHLIALLISMAFTAGIVSANISGYEGRIAKLEGDSNSVRMTVVRIEQKVDDLHDAFLGKSSR